jgi:hypothetical protein
MDTYQAKAGASQEMKAKMDSHHEKLMTIMRASNEKTGHEGGLFRKGRGLSVE